MIFVARLLLPAVLLLPLAAQAASGDPETARLRAQVEQLQSQLRAAQAQCPAAAAAPVAAPATAVLAAPMPAAAAPSPPPAAASVAVVPPPAAAIAAPAVPAGYKLVKVDPKEEPPLPKDDRWRDRGNWDSLSRGMSMDDVEQMLGIEHRVLTANGRTQWGYGKVGTSFAGRVIFIDGRLAVWETPNF